MKIAPEVLESVMKRHATLRSDWSPVPGVVELAEAHDFLPLYADFGGIAGLTSDGNVVEMGWDDAAPILVDNVRRRDLYLLRGTTRYPELRAIVPRRSPEAKDCRDCLGTGTFSIDGQAIPGVICWCGGLGWIPIEWDQT